jgi:dihydroorotate dehydrogenase electron transfer subunit
LKLTSATVISNIELMPEHHLIYVEAPNIAVESLPGQFITVGCGPDFILRRPLSIHRIDNLDQICILFAIAGAGTRWLSQRHKGEKLDLLGPLGNDFSIQPASNNLLLVAGGMGIAPLVFLSQKALSSGRNVKLLLGSRSKNCLYPVEFLPERIETFITTEDGSQGIKGKITDILPEHVDWADQIYACGPLAMYQAIAVQSRKWQIKKPVQISLEVRMGCGVGACYACSIKTKNGMKQVCRDGPVFDLYDIILEEVKI